MTETDQAGRSPAPPAPVWTAREAAWLRFLRWLIDCGRLTGDTAPLPGPDGLELAAPASDGRPVSVVPGD